MAAIDLRKIKKIVCVTYCGRSGSYLLSNLLDGHSNLLSCPPHSLHYSPFKINNLLQTLSKNQKLSIENITQEVANSHPFLFKNAEHHLMLGEIYKNKSVGVDKNLFCRNLAKLLKDHSEKYNQINSRDIFIALHWAYSLCIQNGEIYKKTSVIWQQHIPLDNQQSKFLESTFPEMVFLTAIRRLENSLDSHLQHHFVEKPNATEDKMFVNILNQFILSISKNHTSIPQHAIKFEDIHLKTEMVGKKLCELLEIPFESVLKSTTLDNETFLFSKNGKTISGFNSSLNTEVKTSILTEIDVAFFQVLFNKHLTSYEYDVPVSKINSLIIENNIRTPFGSNIEHIMKSEPIELL
tara:strand:+ start:4184 stop:5239 length:1056 start_codon:yes stop_codon:yes gene_type:complete